MFHINKKFSCPQSFKGRFQPIKVCGQGLLSPLGMGTEREQRPQQVACYRAGDESGGLDLEERRGSGHLKLAYRLPWLTWLTGSQGMPFGVGGGDKGEVMRKAMGENLCENLGVGQGGRGDHCRCLRGAGDGSWGLGRVPEAQPRSFPLLNKVEDECGQWTPVTCVEAI